ncbi:hypothetical protein RJT34_31344 [Clitoria ternatea]|uniref:Cation/H+ exchanger transmembrane domain-containing protein n=1 Tax=Clitoria ternatea TaxID=43366 RepID=A0AAN9EU45_CLITE
MKDLTVKLEVYPTYVPVLAAMCAERTMIDIIRVRGSNQSMMGSVSGSSSVQQQAAGVGILLQIMMLVLAFVLGHVLRRKKIYVLPEASASLLIGLLVGALANISHTQTNIRAWFNFHEEFFLLFLLPPIILYPYYFTKPFFSNFGAIVTFAIFGTFIASIVTGVLVYLGGFMHLTYRLPFVESLMFGALISATDPVTVLSIFQELGSDVNLYALVFGESVLNDAMAISLYRTMSAIKAHPSGQHFFMVVVGFLETFVGSMSAGTCLQKALDCLVMKHYTYSNLSRSSQRFVSPFFELISSLAETFVFIYMGFDIALEKHSWAANVFSCAYLVNLIRPAGRKIPKKHQKALWYSGLRGAMAFALALQSVHDLPEGHGQTIFTATTAIVVLTVLLIGGSTGTMLEALEVVGSDSHINGSPLDDINTIRNFEGNNGYISPDDEEPTSGSKIKMKLQQFHRSAASFTAIDKNYLKPFFTSQNGVAEDEAKLLSSENERFRGLGDD